MAIAKELNTKVLSSAVPREVDSPQSFDTNPEFHDETIGPETQQVLKRWASTLPQSDLPILDIASGRGIEAAYLENEGVSVIAQDPSEIYKKNSFHSAGHRIGVAESLIDQDESIRGILLKDALIFLSPEQREQTFKEAQRVLLKGGTFLIITEHATADRAHYLPFSSSLAQVLTSADLGDSYNRFVAEIARMRSENHFFSIQYRSVAEEIITQAKKAGFKTLVNEYYEYKSKLAQENRWVPRATLVILLQK